MAFMKPEIYHGEAYLVDGPYGEEVVPLDACGDLGPGVPTGEQETALRALAVALGDYLENAHSRIWSIERRAGWLARFSAPGYMDCTPWSLYDSRAKAEAALAEETEDEEARD